MTLLASPQRQPGTVCHNTKCSMRDERTNVCRVNVAVCKDKQVEGQKSGGKR
jgi:hypothetical protein